MGTQYTIRLADRIRAGAPLGMIGSQDSSHMKQAREAYDMLQSELPGMPVIAADEVAQMFYDFESTKGKAMADMFPSLAPPFEKFFIEYPAAPALNNIARVGVFVWADKLDNVEAVKSEVLSQPIWQRLMEDEPINESPFYWHLQTMAVVEHESGAICPVYQLEMVVAADGTRAMQQCPASFLWAEGLVDSETSKAFGQWTVFPALYAISFLHCRNIRVIENGPPAKINKAFLKRTGKELIRFHTLGVDSFKNILLNQGQMGKNGFAKAVHICRGHFATYTSDKPLFGRIVGTVWKPAHARGSAENGIINKEYRLDGDAA